MSRESCWNICCGCILILSFLIIIALIIVGSIGASFYVIQSLIIAVQHKNVIPQDLLNNVQQSITRVIYKYI